MPSNICILKQLFVTAAIFKTIRHKKYLKTQNNESYSKQKAKSRSETIKIPSSMSYETKLKFVEIVMISVSNKNIKIITLSIVLPGSTRL